VPIAAAVAIAGLKVLPADHGRDASCRLDVPGVVIVAGGLLLIVLPLTLGRQEHWPAWTWICLAASIPLLAGFVILERRASARGRQPVLNLRIFTSPAISWGLAEYALVTSTYFALLATISAAFAAAALIAAAIAYRSTHTTLQPNKA
jgi:hypothetical protein